MSLCPQRLSRQDHTASDQLIAPIFSIFAGLLIRHGRRQLGSFNTLQTKGDRPWRPQF
jgi:hypothetical protein